MNAERQCLALGLSTVFVVIRSFIHLLILSSIYDASVLCQTLGTQLNWNFPSPPRGSSLDDEGTKLRQVALLPSTDMCAHIYMVHARVDDTVSCHRLPSTHKSVSTHMDSDKYTCQYMPWYQDLSLSLRHALTVACLLMMARGHALVLIVTDSDICILQGSVKKGICHH